MAELDKLREADLHGTLPASSIKKGLPFLDRIVEQTRSGELLKGTVLDRQPCRVEVEAMPIGLIGSCTCSHYSNFCRHMTALLLKWVRSPETFQQVESPAEIVQAGATPLRVVPVAPPPTRRPKALPDWMEQSWDDRQQLARQHLEEWLHEFRLDDLRALARTHQWTVKGTRKADVITQIVDQLIQPEQLVELVRKLDQEHQQVLRAIAILGLFPTVQIEDIERIAQFWGKLKQHSRVNTYIRHLAETGIILSTEQFGQYVYGLGLAAVPPLIARYLPPLLAAALPTHRELAAATTSTTTGVQGLQLAEPDWLTRTVAQLLLILEQTSPTLRPPMPRPYSEKAFPGFSDWDYLAEEVYQFERDRKSQSYPMVTLTVPAPQYPLPTETMGELGALAGGEDRLEFLYYLMVEVGLLQPGSPVTVWPEVKEKFLRQPFDLQQATLVRAYFSLSRWSELWNMLRQDKALHLMRNTYLHNTVHSPEALGNELAVFRTLVLTTLAWLPDDQWFTLSDLFALLRQVWPKFNQLVWQTRYYRGSDKNSRGLWHLTYRGRALDGATDQEWEQAQGNFVRAMLQGPLHWAGLVDLYSETGKLTAVRFHGLGDLFLDRVASVPLPPSVAANKPSPPSPQRSPHAGDGDRLQVAGEQIIVDPARITTQAHSLLDSIATLLVAKPTQFVYQLDAATVHKSFEAGMTLATLLDEWHARLTPTVPALVEQRLRTWWAAYGQLRLYQDVTIIEFGDDHALAEMKAVTSLNAVLLAEISPRLVLIPKNVVATLAAELENAGYTPQQTETTE
ncbi:MAG: hypothetical protein KF832_27955 [Caldilineaceae bacterium]|nr:hypothetical protein [Caldilineaceae bacterium]